MLTCAYVCIYISIMENNNTQMADILNDFSKVYDARFFKTLGEPVRIQILQYLMFHGRADIRSITETMPQDRSVISRHLSQMESVGILTCEKETRHMFYAINPQTFIDKLEAFLNQVKHCMSVCCPPDKK